MALKNKFLRLQSLVAYLQTESDGDEIFLKYNDEKIAPSDAKFMKMTKDPVSLDIEIQLADDQKWVELELWDYDRFTPNDNLGKFKLLVDEVAENFTAELVRDRQSEGRYVLNWSVIERANKKAPKARK
jgi:hypothetical protein